MTEYGLFDDEGLIEGQFCSREAAHAAIADRYPYSYEEELIVAEVCPEGQRADTCEECNVEAGVPARVAIPAGCEVAPENGDTMKLDLAREIVQAIVDNDPTDACAPAFATVLAELDRLRTAVEADPARPASAQDHDGQAIAAFHARMNRHPVLDFFWRKPWRSPTRPDWRNLADVLVWLRAAHDCSDGSVMCSCSGGYRYPHTD